MSIGSNLNSLDSKTNRHVVVVPDYEALSQRVAEEVCDLIVRQPDCSLGLPTGSSPLRAYEILADWTKQGKISWRRVKCFALDDYLDADEPFSFQHFLETHLYRYTDLPIENRFNPRLNESYDRLIAKEGGLDLCILGIGSNGHICFNEPPTPKASWTHCVFLSDSTMQSNAKYFEGAEHIPSKAITMGISTVLESRRVLLIASGEKKKAILRKALNGPGDKGLPASFITSHPDLLVIADFDC